MICTNGTNAGGIGTTVALAVITLAATSTAAAQTPVGTSISYQGRLNDAGVPANGDYDMQFVLWNAESGGTPVASAQFCGAETIPVVDGVFTVELDFGVGAFAGEERWVEVAVRPATGHCQGCGGACPFTTLSPRQPLTAAPYALYALSGPGVTGGFWSDNGSDIFNLNAGNVGIGTSTPVRSLEVADTQSVIRMTTAASNSGSVIELRNNTASPTLLGAFNFLNDIGATHGQIAYRAAGAMTFRTNQAERMRIDENGNVGIGTTEPSGKLSVITDEASSSAGTFELNDSGQNIRQALSTRITGGNSGAAALSAFTSGGAATAVRGGVAFQGGTGRAGWFEIYNPLNTSPVIEVTHNGQGSAGVFALTRTDTAAAAIYASTAGTGPAGTFSQNGGVNGDNAIRAISTGSTEPTISAANFGAGPVIHALGLDDAGLDGGGVIVAGLESGANVAIDQNEIMARNAGEASTLYINNEGGDVRIGQNGGSSTVYVPVLAITGADVAEKFPVSESEAIAPGTVMEIDPENPGKLRIARGAYNRRVAGVVSGAGDVPVGAILGNLPGHEDAPPIALSGRVWVFCDARDVAIDAGDPLTTSDTPGHAMAARDRDRAHGAVLGKAMSALAHGQTGLVLVLVNLQ